MGDCFIIRRGSGSALPSKDTFEGMSLQDISTVCKAGKASDYWQIGDTKMFTIGSASYLMQIIDFDHDDVTDAESYGRVKAGITLQMMSLYGSYAMNTNGNYTATEWYSATNDYYSTIRKTDLPTIYNAIAADVRQYIVAVNKPVMLYANQALTTLSESITLPSCREVFGAPTTGFGSEGTQYAYYAAGNSRIKKTAGNAAYAWWTRSPTGANAKFYTVSNAGAESSGWVNYSQYIAPCFCI